MLAVIGIMALLSTLILANNTRFGGTVILQNLSYEIALSIRQAQVYGISVRRFGADTYARAYGIHFDTANPSNYEIFADVLSPRDGVYGCPNPGAECELLQSLRMISGYRLNALYATSGSTETAVNSLDITFQRPEPDAYITKNGETITFDEDGTYQSGNIQDSARIEVVSPRGDLRSVTVYVNGQIAVE
jgi:hypothetical protein